MTTIRWLGQAGFEIIASTGESCLIDPYLSDWCAQVLAESAACRRSRSIRAATRPTLVVFSHWHDDHLDPYAIPIIARSSPGTVFVGPPSCALRCIGWGIGPSRVVALDRGKSAQIGPFTITAGFARHEVPGMLAEDAISIAIDVGERRIFHSGDTEYDARQKAIRASGDIDVGLFVINGTGGNMNAREAAFLAAELGVGVAIPMHYGMWRTEKYGTGATLDPLEFARHFETATGRKAVVLKHGETFAVR